MPIRYTLVYKTLLDKILNAIGNFTRRVPSYSWLIWTLIIIGLSLMPSGGLPRHRLLDLFQLDKWAHFLFYAVYSYLILHRLSSKSKDWRFFITKSTSAIFFGSILGLIIEMFQGISPSRHFDYLDIIANIIGCITGVLFYNFLFDRTLKE